MFSQIKDTKHIRRDFHSDERGQAPGVGLWSAGGAQKFIFFKHGYVAYQFDEDGKKNRMQVFFLS